MARRRRYIYSRRGNNRRNIVRGTAAAILMAVVIYFVVAGGLGNWIAEKVILPFMGGGEPSPSEGLYTPVPSVSGDAVPSATAQPTATPVPQTRELTISPIPFYAIQMGAFINQANAESEAKAIRERGAAGFLYTDADRHRVLASAYLTRADADKVQKQLLETQGLESYVLDLYAEGGAVTLRVTASQERLQGMESAMGAYRAALDGMEDVARRLDLGEIGPDAARQELRATAEAVIAARQGLTGGAEVDGKSDILAQYGDMMDEQAKQLLNTADDGSAAAMEISARIKYTYIDSLDRHGKLLQSIAKE